MLKSLNVTVLSLQYGSLQSKWLHYQKPTFRNKGMQEKESIMCEGQIEKSVPRDHSLTSLGKPHDARQ